MRRFAPVLAVTIGVAGCGLGGGPPLEAVYGEARRLIDETAADAIAPYPFVAVGPPVADECHAPYQGPTGDWQVLYQLYVEYETPADVGHMVEAVTALWETRGLEVAPFSDGVTVFPNGTQYRLDFTELPHARRMVLKAQTSCLTPATQDLPATIPDLREEPRHLRGPAARPDATTSDAIGWIERLMDAAAAAAAGDAELESLRPPEPATCFGYSPELFSESVERSLAVDDADRALDAVADAWRGEGLDVVEHEASGVPTIIATSGDLALRARPDEPRSLMLHGTTPCLPPG